MFVCNSNAAIALLSILDANGSATCGLDHLVQAEVDFSWLCGMEYYPDKLYLAFAESCKSILFV